MNYFDISLSLILLWSFYKGLSNGLIRELASLAALVLGVYGAIRFSTQTKEFFSPFLAQYGLLDEEITVIIAFSITFLIILFLVNLIGFFVNKIVKIVALGFLNKVLGGGFRLIKTTTLISIIIFIINTLDSSLGIIPETHKNESIFYYKSVEITSQLLKKTGQSEFFFNNNKKIKKRD